MKRHASAAERRYAQGFVAMQPVSKQPDGDYPASDFDRWFWRACAVAAAPFVLALIIAEALR